MLSQIHFFWDFFLRVEFTLKYQVDSNYQKSASKKLKEFLRWKTLEPWHSQLPGEDLILGSKCGKQKESKWMCVPCYIHIFFAPAFLFFKGKGRKGDDLPLVHISNQTKPYSPEEKKKTNARKSKKKKKRVYRKSW